MQLDELANVHNYYIFHSGLLDLTIYKKQSRHIASN